MNYFVWQVGYLGSDLPPTLNEREACHATLQSEDDESVESSDEQQECHATFSDPRVDPRVKLDNKCLQLLLGKPFSPMEAFLDQIQVFIDYHKGLHGKVCRSHLDLDCLHTNCCAHELLVKLQLVYSLDPLERMLNCLCTSLCELRTWLVYPDNASNSCWAFQLFVDP